MIISFGQHKGKEIHLIPAGYLRWVLKNVERINPQEKQAICKQLGLPIPEISALDIPRNHNEQSREMASYLGIDEIALNHAMQKHLR